MHSSPLLSSTDRTIRWALLGLSTAPLFASISYGQGYRLSGLSCPIRQLTGCPCPTCGMTRSFTAFAQGHWHEAVSLHLFGPVLFGLFAIAAVHIAVELTTQHQYSTKYTLVLNNSTFQVLGLCAYFGYYLYRLLIIGYPINF